MACFLQAIPDLPNIFCQDIWDCFRVMSFVSYDKKKFYPCYYIDF